MNTTMADGARERLIAQIGEALFGQPGLTLMELAEKVKASQPTPSSRWAANGEPDPHGGRYDCERAALVMGDLSDDELANAVFLHGNEQPTMAQIAAGAMLPIAYLTAAKDRIRWLSRALVAASQPVCKKCKGSGEGVAMAGSGPDVYEVDADCTACDGTGAATGKDSLTVGGEQEPVAEAWIVVKEHVWDHGDGGRPTLAYLWPYEFERRVYPSFAAASEFIKAGDWPLGFVAMQIEAPPAQAVDLGQLPDGWRLSKKATCYQLSHGNDIIGNLVGPDAKMNAAIIARVLDSQAVSK